MYMIYNNDDKWYTKFDNGDIYNYGVVEEHTHKPFSLLWMNCPQIKCAWVLSNAIILAN